MTARVPAAQDPRAERNPDTPARSAPTHSGRTAGQQKREQWDQAGYTTLRPWPPMRIAIQETFPYLCHNPETRQGISREPCLYGEEYRSWGAWLAYLGFITRKIFLHPCSSPPHFPVTAIWPRKAGSFGSFWLVLVNQSLLTNPLNLSIFKPVVLSGRWLNWYSK